jgi:hypothetical protein
VVANVVIGLSILVGLALAYCLRAREGTRNVLEPLFAVFLLSLGIANVLGADLATATWWTILCFVIPCLIALNYVVRRIVIKGLTARRDLAKPG